ncbi:MAG: hypothetical protein QM754_11220 [Tepidisphaeraceae bacterium]
MDTAFETDQLLKLLTDALRRGPGSPEWHRAVAELKTVAGPQADEYQLLIAARERLESGRAYREVRAGPAFTRELFGQLQQQPQKASPWSAGTVIKLVLLLTFVTCLGYVVMLLAQSGPHEAQQLSGRLFVTQVHGWTFSSVPADLRVLGPLPIESRNNALHPTERQTRQPAGALVVSDTPIDLVRGTCIEARIDHRPGETAAQLVLAADAQADGALASLDKELAIICDASGVRFVGPGVSTLPRTLVAGQHLLRIKVAGDSALAEVDGQTIWSGASGLGGQGFAAVRLVKDGKDGDTAVQSLRVLAP